mmetsp:Transcript_10805/g.25049  ORF Transcript_10805/g.25049 Transcript_10805/m.25049 type:complete len:123 (+) Transcript_10805:195-563(+)
MLRLLESVVNEAKRECGAHITSLTFIMLFRKLHWLFTSEKSARRFSLLGAYFSASSISTITGAEFSKEEDNTLAYRSFCRRVDNACANAKKRQKQIENDRPRFGKDGFHGTTTTLEEQPNHK